MNYKPEFLNYQPIQKEKRIVYTNVHPNLISFLFKLLFFFNESNINVCIIFIHFISKVFLSMCMCIIDVCAFLYSVLLNIMEYIGTVIERKRNING